MIKGRYNFTLITKILNSWVLCLVFLVIISYLPHWPMPISSWINLGLYALSFILTFSILIKDKYSLFTFLPFSLFFLGCLLLLPAMFIGDDLIFGSNLVSILYYKYIFLFCIFMFAFAVLNYASQVALTPKRQWILFLASFAFTLGVFVFHFHDIFSPEVTNIFNKKFFQGSLTYHLLPVVALFSYGILNPYLKPRYGEYSHSIMTVLALLSIRELGTAISELKHVFLFGIDQIFLTLALILLNFFLFKKYNFLSSTTGAIYSQIVNNDLDIGNLRLESRDRKGFKIFAAFVFYFYQRKNIILPFLLFLVVGFKYLNPPIIVSLNILAFAIVTFFVFFYFIVIYNKKNKNQDFYIQKI